MAATREGGLKAAETNKRLYGKDFYQRMGAKGGRKGKADGVIKGYAAMSYEKRVESGRKGGTISRKGKSRG